jgi:hypothetical protein
VRDQGNRQQKPCRGCNVVSINTTIVLVSFNHISRSGGCCSIIRTSAVDAIVDMRKPSASGKVSRVQRQF